jgi:hypothetical protein
MKPKGYIWMRSLSKLASISEFTWRDWRKQQCTSDLWEEIRTWELTNTMHENPLSNSILKTKILFASECSNQISERAPAHCQNQTEFTLPRDNSPTLNSGHYDRGRQGRKRLFCILDSNDRRICDCWVKRIDYQRESCVSLSQNVADWKKNKEIFSQDNWPRDPDSNLEPASYMNTKP